MNQTIHYRIQALSTKKEKNMLTKVTYALGSLQKKNTNLPILKQLYNKWIRREDHREPKKKRNFDKKHIFFLRVLRKHSFNFTLFLCKTNKIFSVNS